MTPLPPIVTFVAPSGTGKTRLIEILVPVLQDRGLRVGVLKHDAHRLVLDTPGKDSWRYRQAGAHRVVVASAEEFGVFGAVEAPLSVQDLVGRYLADVDLVLTEGFRGHGVPMYRVHRLAGRVDPSWTPAGPVVAWISDDPSLDEDTVLPLNAPEVVADFLAHRHLRPR